MTSQELLSTIQSRAARIAVGASTVRGRGNTGTVAASRGFLRTLDLRQFSPRAFAAVLEKETNGLRDALPKKARRWGIARKVLNIFLRDCLYTTYLNEAYHLSDFEALLELPLDSITVKHLKRMAGRGKLPLWPGVRNVDPVLSAKLQEAASVEAAKRGIARIHLDALWWSVSRDNDGDAN